MSKSPNIQRRPRPATPDRYAPDAEWLKRVALVAYARNAGLPVWAVLEHGADLTPDQVAQLVKGKKP